MAGSATLTIVASKPTMSRLIEQMTRTSRRRRRSAATCWGARAGALIDSTVGSRVLSRSRCYVQIHGRFRRRAEHRRCRAPDGAERARAAVLRARGAAGLTADRAWDGWTSPLHPGRCEVAGDLHQAAAVRDAAGEDPPPGRAGARRPGKRAAAPRAATRATTA